MYTINYNILCLDDIFSKDLSAIIARNRKLPEDWCKRKFTQIPCFDFKNQVAAFKMLQRAIVNPGESKIQIVVDSDLDGICSAAILYKFLKEFYPDVETVYSIHDGKKHGLSKDITIDKDTTLVVLPDSGSNDIEQCEDLFNKGINVICLDHHIIEKKNPYAAVVNCMDEDYPNHDLCGAAVTWLFLWSYCYNCTSIFDKEQSYLLKMLDLVATATISDIMSVVNEDNMYFIQNGLNSIKSNALCAFLLANEVPLDDVTIESIKFKVSPFVSAMVRMGTMPEKILLFRAFVDDYEEFDYEKRGSFGVETENIYDRVVRLCKNAKSRQDRAKQKLLDECQVHDFPHIVLVEYQADKASTLTGLVANELANQYCKPCVVYRSNVGEGANKWLSGSARNYDGSPIADLKSVLSEAFGQSGDFAGHANACGTFFAAAGADTIGNLVEDYFDNCAVSEDKGVIGERSYDVDFAVSPENIDSGFIQKLHKFEHYSGFGFAPVTALVTGIEVNQENFSTMGKNTFNWKIYDDLNDVTYVKFKIDPNTDELVQEFDDIEWDSEKHYNKLMNMFDKKCYINAICTFGLNIYKGEIHAQAIVKDYETVYVDKTGDADWDIELGF